MATIGTTDDLLRLVREDSDFRATMRRELLTAELLEVPQRLTALEQSTAALIEYTTATNRRLDNIEADITVMKDDIAVTKNDITVMKDDIAVTKNDITVMKDDITVMKDDITVMKDDIAVTKNDVTVMKDDITVMKDDITVMKDDIAATKSDVTVMKHDIAATKGDIGVIKNDINGLGEAFRQEVQAQSSYRGAHAQTAANRDRVRISNLFAKFHAIRRTDAMPVRRNTLKTWLQGENAAVVESLNLRERAWETFLEPDIVAEVHDLMADNDAEPAFYIVVEASYTGEAEDIDRATDHAKIVHAVTGLDAYPVVAAVQLDDKMEPGVRNRLYDDIQQFVEANDAEAAFWYPLGSADLRPAEPR